MSEQRWTIRVCRRHGIVECSAGGCLHGWDRVEVVPALVELTREEANLLTEWGDIARQDEPDQWQPADDALFAKLRALAALRAHLGGQDG